MAFQVPKIVPIDAGDQTRGLKLQVKSFLGEVVDESEKIRLMAMGTIYIQGTLQFTIPSRSRDKVPRYNVHGLFWKEMDCWQKIKETVETALANSTNGLGGLLSV